jgi:hypothetical protein
VQVLSLAALAAVLLLGAVAAARTTRGGGRGLAAAALVVVAGAVVVAPSVPVQAPLVVLPLAALAAPRWRDHLPWALSEAAYDTGTWLYLAGQQTPDHRGLPPWAYGALLVLRVLTLGWLVVQGVLRAGPGAGAGGRAERTVLADR